MFNRSREVSCPECAGINFWKGAPMPDDELYCRHCQALVTTYDNYIKEHIRHEAVQMLAQFTEASTAEELAVLKAALTQPQQQASP